MGDLAFQIGLAHLAVGLIPGHNVALVSAGITASGAVGGLRVMAGMTMAKLVWASAALGLLPLVLAAGPTLLDIARVAGGLALTSIGLTQLYARAHARLRARGRVRSAAALPVLC